MYIDLILIVNGVMDAALLAILNKILGAGAGPGRILSGAVLGALWACAAALCPEMPVWLWFFGTYGLTAAAMCTLVFRPKTIRELGRAMAGLYLTACAAGGVMTALYENTMAGYYLKRLLAGDRRAGLSLLVWILTAAGGVLGAYGLLGIAAGQLKRRFRKRTYCRATLCYEGRQVTVRGLLDTGNCLREPVSGRPVHVAASNVMLSLCPRARGVIFVPFQAVGTENGLLPAVCLDWMKVELDHREYCFEHPLVAVSREALSPAGAYQLLLQQEQWERECGLRRPLPPRTGGKIHDDQSIHTQSFSVKDQAQL